MTAAALAALIRSGLARRLAALGAAKLADQLVVVWNPRLRSTAGRAWPREARIELNPRLFSLAEARKELRRTALHEAAHLLAQARHPRRRLPPHGAEWARACADLGIPGEAATHQLPLPRRRVARTLTYRCNHCAAVIHRARPLRRPAACSACCKQFAHNRFDRRFLLVAVE